MANSAGDGASASRSALAGLNRLRRSGLQAVVSIPQSVRANDKMGIRDCTSMTSAEFPTRREVQIAEGAPTAFPLLQAYNVLSCLIERDEPLATLLSASSQWQEVYADELSVLFVRRQTGEPRGEN